jgi:hypothetical protein
MTTYEFVSVMLISPTNSEVIAYVNTILGTIIDLIFSPSTITLVVIILRGEVSSTYKYW